MKGIVRFFWGVNKEMKRVRWPDKKHMVRYSVATITFILFFASFFYIINIIIALIKTLG
ncbi:MAG: preprotein translocase subunit SecE [Bacilli bacterium]